MKVAIYTLCANNNFGNKLQNYALLKILNQYNDENYTVWIENSNKYCLIRQICRYIKHNIKGLIIPRNKKFMKFNRYLNLYNKKAILNNDIVKIQSDFDMIIVGSDQVWNPEYCNNYDIYYLKSFNGKKVSYSASFGISKLDNEFKENIKDCLKSFDYISVREYVGKELIEEFTNRKDIEVLADPTMLLSTDDWDKIICKPKKLKSKKYILMYFLGEISTERMNKINRIAKENECEIINLLDKNSEFYVSGPQEFLYLEKNAYLICTDSFHSCVFAILYNRPFFVFDREQDGIGNMNSRIETLLTKFKLEDRKYTGNQIKKEDLKCNFDDANKIINTEIEKSKNYLNKVFLNN